MSGRWACPDCGEVYEFHGGGEPRCFCQLEREVEGSRPRQKVRTTVGPDGRWYVSLDDMIAFFHQESAEDSGDAAVRVARWFEDFLARCQESDPRVERGLNAKWWAGQP